VKPGLGRSEPCATCPYRRETKLALWAEVEFEKLEANDAHQFGSVFGCHSDRDQAPDERGVCIGWALDQKRRGLPCLPFRFYLARHPIAATDFEQLDDATLDLYDSIEEMHRANYPRRRR